MTKHNQNVTYYVTFRDNTGKYIMKILLKGKDGSVAIMTLVDGADKEEAVRKFKEAHPKDFYSDYFEYKEELPKNREFRDAWVCDKKNNIVIDNKRAKDIHLTRVRHVRNQHLERLDKEQLRYISDSDKVAQLEEQKQLLRDLPANISGLEWPDLLKS